MSLVCVFLWYETDSLSGHLLKSPAMTTLYYNKWVSSDFENKKSGTNRFRCKFKQLSVIWLFFLKKSKENYASYDLTLRGIYHCVKKRHLGVCTKILLSGKISLYFLEHESCSLKYRNIVFFGWISIRVLCNYNGLSDKELSVLTGYQ